MPQTVLRLAMALVLAGTGLFLVAYLLALSPATREKTTGFLKRRLAVQTEAVPVPIETSDAAPEQDGPMRIRWRNKSLTDVEITDVFRRLSRTALKAQAATALDIDVSRELVSMNFSERADFQAKIAADRSAQDAAEAMAADAIRDLEAMMFYDPQQVARVARIFATRERNPAIKAMIEKLLALSADRQTQPGRYNSTFLPHAMTYWSNAAYS